MTLPFLKRSTVLVALAMACLSQARADWPQFLGPTRDGVYSGKPLSGPWPAEGPRKLWVRDVGQGFSGPVVLGKRVFLFHRTDNQELIECFETDTGKTLWKEGVPAHYSDDFGFDEGPRGTPAIQGQRLVAIGADAVVQCRDINNGRLLWSVDGRKQFGARKGFFGLAPSPLIQGSQVILNIGGTDGAGVVALRLEDGSVAWKAGEDEASYASPITASIHGKTRILVLTREALMSLNPENGQTFFRYPWRPAMNASVSAATPLVQSDQVFLTASYDTGAILLDCTDTGVRTVWQSKQAISAHYATCVAVDGYLYGFEGRQEQGCDLRCIEWKTGAVRWTQERLGAGTLIRVDKELLILTEKGELILADADPKTFHVNRRAQILPFLARAHPALSDGVLFARSKDKLFAHSLSADSAPATKKP